MMDAEVAYISKERRFQEVCELLSSLDAPHGQVDMDDAAITMSYTSTKPSFTK